MTNNNKNATTVQCDDNNERSTEWQTIKNKRMRLENTSTNTNNKKQKCDESNRFEILSEPDDDPMAQDDSTADDRRPKPPPIYIPSVSNISKMIVEFKKVIELNSFNYKCLKNNEIRVMVKNVESYRILIKHLEKLKISFHTFQLKQDRAFRFVLKGLHSSTCTESIKAELTLLGHKVKSVMNINSKINKEPLPIFFVDLEQDSNNKNVYEIQHIGNAIVTVEPLKKNNDVVQCYRCQEYGHTQSYCTKEHKYVKCSLNHPTKLCPNSKTTEPRCVHCSQAHTANYKGCVFYKELIKKRNERYNYTRPQQIQTHNNLMENNPFFTESNDMTYAQAANYSQNKKQVNLIDKIEKMIEKQSELMTSLMQMMQTIIAKVCK